MKRLPFVLLVIMPLISGPLCAQAVSDEPLRIMVIGAHPDDPEKVAGTMAKYTALGHTVRLVALTNGDAGHYTTGAGPLAQRRYLETQCAGAVIGADYLVLDNHDGELMPDLETRRQVIRVIREFKPDIVVTHRPNDYHPDHRNTGLLVRDAAYMVTVPNVVSLTPHLEKNPIFMYMNDNFTQPNPFEAEVAVSIDDVIDKKIDMYHCHESQVYEWLPYNAGYLERVPQDPARRREWLKTVWAPRSERVADQFRAQLVEFYGETEGKKVRYAEAFQVSEYGSALSPEAIRKYFPFLP